MKGVVKWFNAARGYGFITPEGSTKDVFVHYSGITPESGYRSLTEGQRVEFETDLTPKGLQAIGVRVIE